MKIIKLALISSIVVATLGLSACSSITANLPSRDELFKEMTQQDGRACIRQSDIRGYGALSDSLVSIDTNRKYYLATTLFQCPSIEFGARAAFVGGFTQFCGGGRDKISTREEACPIKNIFEFESREQAFETYDKVEEKRKEMLEQLKEK